MTRPAAFRRLTRTPQPIASPYAVRPYGQSEAEAAARDPAKGGLAAGGVGGRQITVERPSPGPQVVNQGYQRS